MKKNPTPVLLALIVLSLPSATGTAQVMLEKGVISSGAGRVASSSTVAELTLGQPVAGYATDGRINGTFGFWHEAFVVSSVGTATGAGAITALQVSPNPATDVAVVKLTLARAGHLDVTLHDQTGRQVARLYSGEHGAGDLVVPIDPAALPSGTYHVAVQMRGALLQGSITIIR
jgi:hypothetical protein